MIFMVNHYKDIKEKSVEGAHGAYIRWLITPRAGAKNFAMRYFRIEPNGASPLHSHPYEHEVFVLKGKGELLLGKEAALSKESAVRKENISEGYFALIEANEIHQFKNKGEKDLEFLCIIPVKEENIPEDEKNV